MVQDNIYTGGVGSDLGLRGKVYASVRTYVKASQAWHLACEPSFWEQTQGIPNARQLGRLAEPSKFCNQQKILLQNRR